MRTTTVAILAIAAVVVFWYYRRRQATALAAAKSGATAMPSKNVVLKGVDYAMDPSQWVLKNKVGGVVGNEADSFLNSIPEQVSGGDYKGLLKDAVSGGWNSKLNVFGWGW
jgi:hypothetical protein